MSDMSDFERAYQRKYGDKIFTHAPDSAARLAEQSAEIARLQAKVDELNERLGAHDICSQLIDAWCAENGGKITWGRAIQITAIINKMDDNERSRLLTLDEPDMQAELVSLRDQVSRLQKELEEAKNKFSSLAVVGFYNFKLHRFFDDVNEAKRYGHYKPVFSAIDASLNIKGGAE